MRKIHLLLHWTIITSDSTYIGTLRANTDAFFQILLGLTISGDVPDKGIATVNLLLKDQLTEKHYTIDVCIHAPELQIISCALDDKTVGNGNYIADPGETFNLVFEINNQGSSDISGQFNISCPQTDLSIVDPTVNSGTLKSGQVTNIPIMVKLSEAAASGSLFTVTATLNCDPYIVSKDFTFRVGKTRESFEAASFNVFPWINISPIPWVITSETSYDGTLSAKSGAITNNGSTSLIIRTVYSMDDSIKFYYRVSSEPNYDILSFKINDVEVFRKSGEIPWTQSTIPVKAGSINWNGITVRIIRYRKVLIVPDCHD